MRGIAQALRISEDNKRGFNPIGRAVKAGLSNAIAAGQGQIASPGDTQMAQQSPSGLSPSLGRAPPAEVQQHSALVGMLNSIMSRGGPKNPREQQFLMQIAQAIEALPRGGVT